MHFSRNPSPSKLIAITVRLMASPGANEIHGAVSTKARPLLIISPQSAAGGCTPKLRKLSTAPTNIANTTRKLASTISTGHTFGNNSRSSMYQPRSPRARAASMNSPLIRSSVTLRVTRAIGGMYSTPMAIAVFIRFGGVTTRISNTSSTGGNDIITSSTRMISSKTIILGGDGACREARAGYRRAPD